MSLAILKRNAAAGSDYIRFDDLEVGKYRVKKFSLCDNLYGSGKRVMVWINNGYVILPQRMAKDINTKSEIEKLNQNNYIMIFGGKDEDPPHRINIDFDMIKSVKRSAGLTIRPPSPKKRKIEKQAVPTKKLAVTVTTKKPLKTVQKKPAAVALNKKRNIRKFIDDEAEEEDEHGNIVHGIDDDSGSDVNEYDYTDGFIDDSELVEVDEEAAEEEEEEEVEELEEDDRGDNDGGKQIDVQEIAHGSNSIAGAARKIFAKKQQLKKKSPAKE